MSRAKNEGDTPEMDHSGHISAQAAGSPSFSVEGSAAGAHDQAHDQHDAHGDHSAHDPAQFRRKFWVSLALTIPTLIFSTGLQHILGLNGPRCAGSQYIPAIFGLVLFVYGGLVFLRGGWSELRARQPGMMTLISLAIVVAFGYSAAVTAGLRGMDFWWELSALITIMLLGHWIEMSAVMGAQNALGELARLLPDEAELSTGEIVAVARLAVGDLVIIRPGSAIPADGEVTEGESDVDEALLTGESTASFKLTRSTVIAGSINGSGSLTVRVTKTGGDTALAGIMKLVEQAQQSKSGAQVLADRAAALLFYVSLGSAIITLVVWLLLKPYDPSFVLERVVSVLVIACPHALGLAIPLVSLIATTNGARAGILVRTKLALERARRVDVVLFDKTGTLTLGQQGVASIVAVAPHTENEVLALAAVAEAQSEHPISRAIVDAARQKKLAGERAVNFRSLAGRGVEALAGTRLVTVASSRLVAERGIHLPLDLVHANREHSSNGLTVVFVLVEGEVFGLITIADVIRAESAEAVALLKKRGVRVAMLTGDSREVGDWVAAALGIDEVFAQVLPGDKAAVVIRLQGEGRRVAMVGDGVNDAPALAQADVGIAIGAGSDVAIESAGIVLASSDPRAVADVITLSRATWRKELQNLFWAAGYNVVGIPLAAGALFGAGILLPPVLAAVFMSVSTIVVALNAQLLRLLKLGRS